MRCLHSPSNRLNSDWGHSYRLTDDGANLADVAPESCCGGMSPALLCVDITRGRCGSFRLYRTTLSSATHSRSRRRFTKLPHRCTTPRRTRVQCPEMDRSLSDCSRTNRIAERNAVSSGTHRWAREMLLRSAVIMPGPARLPVSDRFHCKVVPRARTYHRAMYRRLEDPRMRRKR
jgi:hypothetical protein